VFYSYRRDVVGLVNATRLPAIYPEREYADDGGLMSYGANVRDNFRRAADYVDRILKGANPADLSHKLQILQILRAGGRGPSRYWAI
jgi:putative tryptophan/tyrosine transport system substrate-binding protein